MSGRVSESARADSILLRVYGDSLGLPRAANGVEYQDTYAELVSAALRVQRPRVRVSLYNRSVGGITIDKLYERYLSDSFYFGSTPQVLIIQGGIVDCAPRPIPRSVRDVVARSPGPVRAVVARFLHHARPHILNAGLKWRLTGERLFSRTLSSWIAHAGKNCARTFVYNIAPTTPAVEAHSPGLGASIIAYNKLIAEAVSAATSRSVVLVDIYSALVQPVERSACISEDGHHITRAGHDLYAERLLSAQTQAFQNALAPAPGGAACPDRIAS